jgi:hypothetical protein
VTQPAVAVLDAPAADAEALPVADEALPENAIATEMPEIDEETPPETEATPETPAPKTLDDLSDDEFESHPRFKDFLARKTESARRTAENATVKKIREDSAKVAAGNNLTATVKANIEGLIKHIEAGNELDPADYSARLANLIAGNAWQYHAAAAQDLFNGALAVAMPSDYKFARDEVEKLRTLHEDVAAGRTEPTALYEYRIELLKKAAVEERLPAEREKWEKERATADRERARTDSQRAADSTRDGQPRPTAAGASSNAGGEAQLRARYDHPDTPPAERQRIYKLLYPEVS